MKTLKGLILRDSGQIDAALEVFNGLSNCSSKFGNIARCYQLKDEYTKALDNLKISLYMLRHDDASYNHSVNFGYAYLWIAEVYHLMNEDDISKKFLLLCQENWKEYAPGLLNKTYPLMKELGSIDMNLNPSEIQIMIDKFLRGVEDIIPKDTE